MAERESARGVSGETGLAGPARAAWAGGRKERGRKRAGAGLGRAAREEKKEMGRGGGREGLGRGKGFGPCWFGLLGWFLCSFSFSFSISFSFSN